MAAATTPQVSGISRREFLYYIWTASIALYTLETLGLIIWFAIPRIREGEFGGIIPVEGDKLPKINAAPANFSSGRFWLVNLDTTTAEGEERMYRVSDETADTVGVAAIYKVCTHLGCIYSWNDATNRFECPCHGSKYRLDGRRIQDPAPRTLDRFPVEVVLTNGDRLNSESDVNGFPLPLQLPAGAEVAEIRVDTGARRDGPAEALIQDLAP